MGPRIPLSDIDLDDRETDIVMNILRSKWLSMGPVTQQFEEKFSRYIGTPFAFGVSNCTAALHMAHVALGIKEGDEVIVPSLTFVATSNAILYCGGTPVFADIGGRDDFNVSPEDIERKITDRTKAITIVHYAGYPCDMGAIMDIARDHGLKVVEDCAHAPGATYRGKRCGTIGDIGCFSFFANKNLSTGEGGMIVTGDEKLAEKIKVLRSHGMTSLTWDRHKGHAHSYDVVDLGYNYRINELASGLGIAQLEKLDAANARRKVLVQRYAGKLKDILGVSVPFQAPKGDPSYHIMPVLLDENIDRERVIDELREQGIQTSIHYPPIHTFTYYRNRFGSQKGMLPATEYAGMHELTLPLHSLMSDDDVDYVVDRLQQSVKL